jgi:hypothetical protein
MNGWAVATGADVDAGIVGASVVGTAVAGAVVAVGVWLQAERAIATITKILTTSQVRLENIILLLNKLNNRFQKNEIPWKQANLG